jgi:hypothetical protein
LYQLRAKMSASRVFVESRVANSTCVSVAAKNMGIQNVQQLESSYTVLLYVAIICTHTELLNAIDNAQLLYHVTV